VRVVLRELDQVMEEEQIPRAPFSCDLCGKPIDRGFLHTFHVECVKGQYEVESDLRPLKELALRDLAPGHPARELVLSLPDRMPSAEIRGVALGMVYLLKLGTK
jgi:hypothetical protein